MSLNADLKEFIELLNSRGVEYVIVGAHSLAISTEMEGLHVFMLSKQSLIRNKRAVGRPQDIADLESLEDESE
jgi:hypothetical protein